MTRTALPIHLFLVAVIIVLLFTLNLECFYGIGGNANLETVATSSFFVYTDGTNYYGVESVTGTMLIQDKNCSTVVTSLMSLCKESGCITFKAGAYQCNLTVNNEMCILGEGRAATVIYGTITLNSEMINGTPCSHNVLIQNLRMDGQNRLEVGIKYESRVPSVPLITVQNVDVENYVDCGMRFINASDCLFDNVVIGNCGTAIYYTTDHNFGRITNCELLNYRRQGFYTDAQVYLSSTVFSAMQNSQTVADIVLDNAFGTITGCWFENNRQAPYAPCIDMPNTCYRPLVVTGCFFANQGGDIIRMRNAFNVSIMGNFFSQQSNAGVGWCVHLIQGSMYWSGNQLDPAYSGTLRLFKLEDGTVVKTT